GIISVNGAAAHKASPGDRVIICAYASLSQQELANFKPTLVYLDEQNRITHSRNSIPLQVA
ncbi:MAG: aspartate 1-decarboxylase, partial [Gammaproteobacteria bacterium]|nr:aspartate 1-decarboxylase [Gammaproteobacteria bacterium]